MDVTPLIPEGRQVIQGYGDGRFMVTQTVHDGAVIVMPEMTLPWPVGWARTADAAALIAALTVDSFQPLFENQEVFDILLIGCGPKQIFVPPALRQAIREKGPVVEMMDTGAACRTYNLLLAEERRVAAAVLPIVSAASDGPNLGGPNLGGEVRL
jgi:uncharacterized protein